MNEQNAPVILQVLPCLHETGGVERGTIEIARAISQNGWKALVASAPGNQIKQLTHAGGQHLALNLKTKNPLKIWLNSFKLEQLIRKHKVDIVHARSRAPAWSAYLAAKRAGVPFMTTFHGVYGLENSHKKKYNEVMVKGERIIAVSEFIAKHIEEEYAPEISRVRVIYRGVDLKTFQPDRMNGQRMIDLIKSWNIPDHLPIILFPGRITRWKGQDVFIKALAKLQTRNFFAVLVGDDTQHPQFREEVEALIHQHRLEGHARMVGSTPHMPEAYKLSKLVVATSVEPEAFGRVVLEAQAMGKLVIATNHGGAMETVLDGKTGWLVEPNGVDALAKTIDYALHAEDETVAWMSAQGIAQAQLFSTDMMCEKTLNVYKELLPK